MAQSTSKIKYDYVIIDPFNLEQVRSSFCWLQYLLYSSLKEEGKKVKIVEGFKVGDSLPDAKLYFVSLYSYQQIETSMELASILKSVYFIGYNPLIESLNFTPYHVPKEKILLGMANCVKYYSDFKEILLSDSDMHVAKYQGVAWPLFTTYGCVNHCKFCPVGANCKGERITLPEDEVFNLLDICEKKGCKELHFADEDFFMDIDRAYRILNYKKGKDFQYIALGTAGTVLKFIDKYGAKTFLETGMKVIEIGLESASKNLNSQMNKVSTGGGNRYEKLAEKAKGFVDIFWLTMTFYPGETVASLRETGIFLEKYGYKYGELYSRIQTNSSVGGLGQFFLPYVGTEAADSLSNSISFQDRRFSRLYPNIIPQSFLESKIKTVRKISVGEKKWFRLYFHGWEGDTVSFFNRTIKKLLPKSTVRDLYVLLRKEYDAEDVGIILALCSRLGVIE